MLTQSAPAIVNALSGALPENVIQALTQSLGNCNQPLTHRAPINLQPRSRSENGPATYGPGAWRPQDYYDLMPSASDSFSADVPGWGAPGGTNNHNWYGDTFSFPTSQEFNLNNYYGGPNVFNAGDSYFDQQYTVNHTTENHTTNNLTVNVINGRPVRGPAGRPGARGARGFDGNVAVDVGLDGLLPRPKNRQLLTGVRSRRAQFSVVTDVRFDADTCRLLVDKVDLPPVVTRVEPDRGTLTYYGP
jgi:hypothetical protein